MAYDVMANVRRLEQKIEDDHLPGVGSRTEFLGTARKRFEQATSRENKNRSNAVDDLKFLAGDQWPAAVKAEREAEQKPCLTVNKIPTFLHQITNDQRQNRPAINISPVGDKGDVETAKMLKGLIRYCERRCGADIAYDTGFKNAVANGFGYWRVLTEYEDEDSFDQVLVVQRIRNPFTVYIDPTATDPCAADARWAFISEMIPREEFKERYPNAQPLNWTETGFGDDYRQWIGDKHVRVAEYYLIQTKTRRVVALRNGHIGYYDELSDEVKERIKADKHEIVRERATECDTVMCYKITAKEILESYEWAGSTIPIVRILGDETDVEGEVVYSGIVRGAKDPQRMYNYWVTKETESVALQGNAPYIMEEGQVEGHEIRWKQANRKTFPYLLYKPTNTAGKPAPPPRREAPPQVSPGIIQAKEGAAQDMMATTGVRFDATKSERVQDESGVALRQLRQNTDLGAYHYIDNLGFALKRTGDIFLEVIPKIFDTQRIVTILREDGGSEHVRIDPTQAEPHADVKDREGKTVPSYNLGLGQYEVTVTIGPSYATKRLESANQMFQFGQAFPGAAPYIADLVAKESDWPGAEEIAKRLAMTLPPGMLQPDEKDMSPQVQALVMGLKQQLQQAMQERQQLIAAVQDKDKDRALDADKINKDYEAKILAIVEKAQSAAEDRATQREAAFLTHLRAELDAIRSLATQPAGQRPGAVQ